MVTLLTIVLYVRKDQNGTSVSIPNISEGLKNCKQKIYKLVKCFWPADRAGISKAAAAVTHAAEIFAAVEVAAVAARVAAAAVVWREAEIGELFGLG
jgi:hypothetical protein